MKQKGRNTKQKILEESMKLFSVSGFDTVSIRAIAEAVGVGNSALYKHFKSKKEILNEIVSYSVEYYGHDTTKTIEETAGKNSADAIRTYVDGEKANGGACVRHT